MKTKTVYELKSDDELMEILGSELAVEIAKAFNCSELIGIVNCDAIIKLYNKVTYHLETRVKSKEDILITLMDYSRNSIGFQHKYKVEFLARMFQYCGYSPIGSNAEWDSAWLEEVWIKDGE